MLDLLTLPVICIPRQSRSYSFNRNDVELIGFKFLVLPTALIRVKIWTFVKIEIYGLSMTAEHTDLALIGGACQLTLSQVLTGPGSVIRSSSSIVDSFYLLTSTLHSHWCHDLVSIPDWFRSIIYTSHLLPDCICLILSYQTGSRSVAWWEYIPLEASPHHITSDTSPGPALWWEHYLLFTENRLEYPQPSTKLITIHPGKRIPRSYILVF